MDTLTVVEMQEHHVSLIADYWFGADEQHLIGMGVDLVKMPSRTDFVAMISTQLTQDYPEKTAYCTIWQLNEVPVGHCNVNKIEFGETASMHLHLWKKLDRNQGYGAQFVKMSLPYFFNNLSLKRLYSEPYALNIAPNKTLEKSGFRFVKQYITTPGYINFEQPVNHWEININDKKGTN